MTQLRPRIARGIAESRRPRRSHPRRNGLRLVEEEVVQDGGIGAETISLRGLGANRTLVLLRAGIKASLENRKALVRKQR